MAEPQLFCTVYRFLARDETNSTAQVLHHPPLLEVPLPITGKVARSDELPDLSRFVELVAGQDCLIAIGNGFREPDHFVLEGERLIYGCFAGMRISVKCI